MRVIKLAMSLLTRDRGTCTSWFELDLGEL